jgi:hypothetical protein
MRTFEKTGEYFLTGRGMVITTVSDTDNREYLHKLLCTIVMVSGTPFKVKGVESFAKADISIGDPISLLVEKISNND